MIKTKRFVIADMGDCGKEMAGITGNESKTSRAILFSLLFIDFLAFEHILKGFKFDALARFN